MDNPSTYATTDQVDESSETKGVLREEVASLRRDLDDLARRLIDAGIELPRKRGGQPLTANFTSGEFDCKDGTPVPPAAIDALRDLCERVLQPMRDAFGLCTVSSGYRHDAYNQSIGGAPNSYHVYDVHIEEGSVAADVWFETGSPGEWGAMADQLLGGAGGVGIYHGSGFTHCDNARDRVWRGEE